MEELSVECTSISLRLRSRLYATIGGCGRCLAFVGLWIKCESSEVDTV